MHVRGVRELHDNSSPGSIIMWHAPLPGMGTKCALATLQGDMAYKYDKFGPTISVTRKIRSCGSSEYWLGHHGCLVMRKSLPRILVLLANKLAGP